LSALCKEFVFSGLDSSLSAFAASQPVSQLEHSQLVTKVAELVTKISELEDERASQSRVIQALQTKLAVHHSRFEKLEQLCSSLQARCDSLASSLAAHESHESHHSSPVPSVVFDPLSFMRSGD
jgi:uncharacterized coiled-coil protein SlyX